MLDPKLARVEQFYLSGQVHDLSAISIGRASSLKDADADRLFRRSDSLGQLLLASNESPNSLSKQGGVEWLTERFVEDRAVETTRVIFIAQ